MTDHPASWRMPTPEQMEKLASDRLRTVRSDDPGPDGPLPKDIGRRFYGTPRAAGKPWLSIQQMRLSKIPRELLRLECARCTRCVEIQRLDAVKLYGPHAIWKDVGKRGQDDA